MAKPKALPATEGKAPGQGSSALAFTIAMVAITLFAGLGGASFGLMVLPIAHEESKGKSQVEALEPGKPRFSEGALIKTLAPIVTNLAGSSRTWIRLESSIIIEASDAGDGTVLASQVGDDIIAFLRTVSAKEIEGASGYQHLREDLNDRVRVRSGGKVRELIIQALILE